MKTNFKGIAKKAMNAVSKNSPSILAGIGVAGFFGSIVLAIKATHEAEEKIEEVKEELDVPELTPQQTVKTVWKCYIPTAVVAGCSAVSIFAGNHISGRRNAALAAACTLSDQAYREYKQKVTETIGEKKEKQIRDEVMQDRVNRTAVSESEIIDTGLGSTLCFDSYSGRLFYADIDKMKRAVADFDLRLLRESCMSLNEWYDEINMPHIKLGDDLMFHIDKGYLEIDFGSILVGNTPCVYVEYNLKPREFYR